MQRPLRRETRPKCRLRVAPRSIGLRGLLGLLGLLYTPRTPRTVHRASSRHARQHRFRRTNLANLFSGHCTVHALEQAVGVTRNPMKNNAMRITVMHDFCRTTLSRIRTLCVSLLLSQVRAVACDPCCAPCGRLCRHWSSLHLTSVVEHRILHMCMAPNTRYSADHDNTCADLRSDCAESAMRLNAWHAPLAVSELWRHSADSDSGLRGLRAPPRGLVGFLGLHEPPRGLLRLGSAAGYTVGFDFVLLRATSIFSCRLAAWYLAALMSSSFCLNRLSF
jgi:hypothetical protein